MRSLGKHNLSLQRMIQKFMLNHLAKRLRGQLRKNHLRSWGSSAEMNVQEKQKKKKKLLKSGSIQNSDLSEILAVGPCQNSLLDVSHDLIASIKKDRIESEESMRESEKLFALNSPFQYIQ
ncbi:hypothetical protein C2G38_2051118 [Gigaspora rosea]|uniref:Uncharacterized protein n=1 Tax=Gigaspora rosea TaxID=44941 RepID=A0A397TSN2_9GLOM|nr:hypothetical protein C2G38_2051118 [Gigaspora rosea]